MSMRKAWALFLAALAMAGPLAAERVALVIGNGAYGGEVPPLSNPGNDARAMAAKLRGLGFAVVEGGDLDRSGFFSKMKEFSRRAKDAEAALLFYAGHGVQVDGKNYLIPVSMETLGSKVDLLENAVNLDYVLAQMKGRTNLVFLDACRDNPFRSMRSSSGSGGLAAVSKESMGKGFLISYAAAAGELASDGSGRNSPYTEALLKHLGTPGESVLNMLTRVTADVEDATEGKQEPWMNSSLRPPPFSFAPGVVGPIQPLSSAGGGCDTDLLKLNWDVVKDSRNEGELAKFVEEYESCRGAGVLVTRARNLLEELRKGAAEPAPAAERKRPGRRFRDCDECPQMVVLPAGSFVMGSPESEKGRDGDEGPQHRVTIGEPFAVGAYEVTFEEWDACASNGGCDDYRPDDESWGRGRRPVIKVSWDDAQGYVRWLSRKTGKEYRLLSEAEWEYAARAGSGTRYWWGDEIGSGWANCDGCGSRWDNRQTGPVGSFRPNGFGLYDVHGNVREWVRDCWNESYAGAPSNGQAWERGDCTRRVLRGGSWNSLSWNLRSANRSGNLPGSAPTSSVFVLPGRSRRESLPLYLMRTERRCDYEGEKEKKRGSGGLRPPEDLQGGAGIATGG